jgi:uncharacterized protein YecT (DUF1311 family)
LIFLHLLSIGTDTDGAIEICIGDALTASSVNSQLGMPSARLITLPSTPGASMKTLSGFPIGFCLILLAGGLACREPKKAPEVAKVAQDTMLLRDLAEANKNTASAAAMDNSLNTVRTTREQSSPAMVDAAAQSRTPGTRVVARPPAGSSQVLTSGTRGSSQNDSPGRVAAFSGKLCDSPSPADQRSCLNRSIVQNDADLNRTYQDLLAQARKSGGPELEDRFKQSQREWVNVRDSECVQRTSDQGALWARARGRCLADYSARRTAELQRTLNSLRGQ